MLADQSQVCMLTSVLHIIGTRVSRGLGELKPRQCSTFAPPQRSADLHRTGSWSHVRWFTLWWCFIPLQSATGAARCFEMASKEVIWLVLTDSGPEHTSWSQNPSVSCPCPVSTWAAAATNTSDHRTTRAAARWLTTCACSRLLFSHPACRSTFPFLSHVNLYAPCSDPSSPVSFSSSAVMKPGSSSSGPIAEHNAHV